MRTSAVLASFALLLAACGGGDDAAIDAAPVDSVPVDVAVDAEPPFVAPTMLSETGLYSDIATKTIAAGVDEFMPRWQLWSDAAVKRRWILLPAGAHIDTADLNWWVFPKGTKLWKEFVRDGARIETRFLQKIGDGNTWADWFVVSFQWNVGETEATAVPDGVPDDTGPNDIPSRSDCRKCHGDTRNPSVVLGFGALQLDYTPTGGLLDLQALVDDGRLTAPPTRPGGPGTPFFPLPAGDDLARDALGYLHANCGGCHNLRSDVHGVVPIVLRHDVTMLTAWNQTPGYLTTVDVVPSTGAPGATAVIEPGVPAQSALYYRVTTTGGQRMPPVGREVVDPTGTEAIRAWIASLPPTP